MKKIKITKENNRNEKNFTYKVGSCDMSTSSEKPYNEMVLKVSSYFM